jgi:hypothetical protein
MQGHLDSPSPARPEDRPSTSKATRMEKLLEFASPLTQVASASYCKVCLVYTVCLHLLFDKVNNYLGASHYTQRDTPHTWVPETKRLAMCDLAVNCSSYSAV